MRKIRLVILIITTILFAGCASTSTVTGTVTFREQVEFPAEGVVVIIKVEDISKADAPAITIGEQIIENPGNQDSIPFEIEYNPDDIDERYTYAIRVRIEVDGKLWYTNTSRYNVITRGNPTSGVEVIVDKQGEIR
jgi:putative lipoprotein